MREVDSREPKTIIAPLLAKGWECKALSAGDFRFGAVDDRTVGIERKEVHDLLNSIVSGRLADQLKRLQEEAAIPILLVEGWWASTQAGQVRTTYGEHRTTYHQLDNWLLERQHQGILVVRCPADRAVERVVALHDFYQKAVHMSDIPRVPNNPHLRVMLSIEGIGPAKAKALLAQHGSPKGVMDSTLDLPGVGPETIRRIREALT